MTINLSLPRDQVAAFCRKNHILRLQVFGSILRDDFGPESDIDVLAEFDPNHIPGWEIVSIADELSDLLGRPVDFTTPGGLSQHIREDVLASAEVIYEQAT